MFDRIGFRLRPVLVCQVPLNQAIQLVTVGSVSAKGFFIEQPLDAATRADLIGMLLQPNRPAHVSVPATAKNH